MSVSSVRIEHAATVAYVTIDRPPVNALNEDSYLELTRCFDQLSLDVETRVAILGASGERAFCAGTDIRDFGNQHQDDPTWVARHAQIVRACFESIYRCTKPVIAAVRAPALGAGVGLLACCDAVVVSANASVGLPEIDVGVLGGAGFLMRLIPSQQARLMQYTGRRITGRELARFGSVIEAPDGVAAEDVALGLAQEIASKNSVAVRLAKEGFNHLELTRLSLLEGYGYEQTLTERLSSRADAREAAAATLARYEQ